MKIGTVCVGRVDLSNPVCAILHATHGCSPFRVLVRLLPDQINEQRVELFASLFANVLMILNHFALHFAAQSRLWHDQNAAWQVENAHMLFVVRFA